MELNPIVPTAESTSAAERSRTTLAEDFDNFLTLLTTQLANQDPLDPVDSNEFVDQLVSFTGVEQAVNTNAHLEELVGLISASQTVSAVGYLGTTIEAKGNTSVLVDGQAEFTYQLPQKAGTAELTISNDKGEVVFRGNANTESGEHVFSWDGRNNEGIPLPDGLYSISVSAKSVDGTTIPVDSFVRGRVTGIETVDGDVVLVVNGNHVPLTEVISVVEETPPPEPQPI